MLSDKELKKKYLPIFWKNPEKYFPLEVLKGEGFSRKNCSKCGKVFWSVNSDRSVCGDPACSPKESFGFIGKSPARNKLSYVDVWKKFSKMFEGFGYKAIKRYPIVARWNPTMEFTNSSISAFQPYVVSGEVKPPANPLVIPQFCFRTVDIDNVGISGAHNTVFNMIGQHQFVPKEKWDQAKSFRDIYQWIIKGIGLKKEDVTFHEDSWAGGGNFGCCMEFFSKGCELGNQVYMLYEQTAKSVKDLKLKVLDMGMGMERNAWFTQGTNNIYDATFPDVMKKVFSSTGVNYDKKIIQKYVPHAGVLNIDEVDDIKKAWKDVAKKVGVDVEELRSNVLPLAGAYSVAEHARSLLILLGDGALPSNSGQAYNIRVMLRRALGFIDKYDWNLNLNDICDWHARELRSIFPELKDNLEDVKKILDVEISKYKSTKQKSRQIVQEMVKKKIGVKDLIKVYDEKGISPELIKEEGEKQGKEIEIPDNFYSKVSELHETIEKKHVIKKEVDVDLVGVKDTEILYYNNYAITEFKAKVLKQDGKFVVLDRTYFYPTSGGQLHDIGTIDGCKVVNVVKEGNIVVHILKEEVRINSDVECVIDMDRRLQLAQHHTAAHILNAAARRILGNHINQSGAHKDIDKARLDITHYASLSDEEVENIEKEANKIINEKINVNKMFIDRDEAEKKYGMRIYQGGAVPGSCLRIVEIPEVDVEACGGTHLNNTFETGMIKILKSGKISDSVVRLEYVSGDAAGEEVNKEKGILDDVAEILGVDKKGIAIRAEEVFRYWKLIIKKKKSVEIKFSNEVDNLEDKELLEKTARVLKTQIEHISKTLKRFLRELDL
jgi:alanyl-tRNA synthetase